MSAVDDVPISPVGGAGLNVVRGLKDGSAINEKCKGLRPWLDKFHLVDYYDVAAEQALQFGADHVTELLDLEPQELKQFESKLELNPLKKQKYDKAREELQRIKDGTVSEGGQSGNNTSMDQTYGRRSKRIESPPYQLMTVAQDLADLVLPSSFTQPKDMPIYQQLEPILSTSLKSLVEVCSNESLKDGKHGNADDVQRIKDVTAGVVAVGFRFMIKYKKLAREVFVSEPEGGWGYTKLLECSGSPIKKAEDGTDDKMALYKELYVVAKKLILSEEKKDYEDLGPDLQAIKKETYDNAMENIVESANCRQVGVVNVYTEAIVARMELDRKLKEVEENVEGVETLLADLKGLPRVIEKMVMRPKSGLPWDLVRAQVFCKTMSQIAKTARIIVKGAKVVGLNDRFKNPTPCGWSDVAIYLQIGSIVVEVQLLHDKMKAARKDMGADEAYHEGRFAGEFLAYVEKQLSTSVPHSVAVQIMEHQAVAAEQAQAVKKSPKKKADEEALKKKAEKELAMQSAGGSSSTSDSRDGQEEILSATLGNEGILARRWWNLGNEGGGKVGGIEYSAEECYTKALEVNPKYANAWDNLGNEGGGKVNGIEYSAEECYVKALEANPKYANAWNNLGEEGGGRVNDVEYSEKECYVKALELNPKHDSAWENLRVEGGGKVNGIEYSEKECYVKAVEANPKHDRARHRVLCGAHGIEFLAYLKKEHQAAAAEQAEAVKKSPKKKADEEALKKTADKELAMQSAGGSSSTSVSKDGQKQTLSPKKWWNLGNEGGGKVNGGMHSQALGVERSSVRLATC